MIYYERIEMTWALKLDESFPLRIVKPGEEPHKQGAEVVSFNIFRILKIIDDNINYYLAPSYIKILTYEQRHKILQNLAWNEDIFKKLTDKEKLKILEKLFVWDEKKLENLSDTEKLWIFDKLLEWNKGKKVENLSYNEKFKIFNDLFFWKEWELDSAFLYKWKWAELYAKISEDASYPFIKIEKDYLENLHNNKEFKKILEKCKYITDVGCWDGQKAISLLKEADRKWTYYAEDYSMGMLDRARNKIKENAPEINLWGLVVLEPGKKNLLREFNNNMYLFLWWTICNMTDEQIIDILKKMDNNWIISWNKILLSYFTAPNSLDEIEKLIKIYNSKSNKDFHENGMDMLWLSKEEFEYDTIYELDNWTKLKLENWKLKPYEWELNDSLKKPLSWRIKWIIRAKQDFEIFSSTHWIKEIKKWQEFTLHYSRRFTEEKIKELFEKSGCKTNFTHTKEGVSISLLNKEPTKTKAFIEKYQKLLITALVALWIWVWSWSWAVLYNQHQKELKQTELKMRLAMDGKTLDYHHQESLELISALNLDELNNEKDKRTIISLFNKYIGEQKKSWIPTERLIMWFYKEYWSILIDNFWLTHEPYDFFGISKSLNFGTQIPLFDITKKFETSGHELSLTPRHIVGNHAHFESIGGLDYWVFSADIVNEKWFFQSNTFEYKDWWNTYLILKVKVWKKNGKPSYIYVGAENKGQYYPEFSTKIVNQIHDKSWLDSEIVLNTAQLWNFNLVGQVDIHGHIDIHTTTPLFLEDSNSDMVIKTAKLNDLRISVNTVYIWWKLYYTIMLPTRSWNHIWLASKSTKWPFTTTMFNKIAKDFSSARLIN